MEIKQTRCPNCSAPMEKNNNTFVCPYCDTVIVCENEPVQEVVKEKVPLLKLFADQSKLLKDAEVWNSLCDALDDEYSFRDYVTHFEMLANEGYSFTTQSKQDKLFLKLKNRIDPYLSPNEYILLFCDEGVFAKANEGYVLTNFNVFFLKKNKITQLLLKDVKSIKKEMFNTGWMFNENEDMVLGNISTTGSQRGLIISYILSAARRFNGDTYTINVYSE